MANIDRVLEKYSDPAAMASVIEHTLLKPSSSLKEVEKLVLDTRRYGFACAVLSPYHARRIASLAKSSGVDLCAVIGFPSGFHSLEAKMIEIRYVAGLVNGVDIVANTQALMAGDISGYKEELADLVGYARDNGIEHVKIIVEAPLLDDSLLEEAVSAVSHARADYVKTSTGVYSKGGDPVTVLRTAIHAKRYSLMVKAAGGIRTAIEALIALASGAHRLGTSSGPQVIETLKRLTLE